MKFLLAAVNAKYIHSNPAVYSLRAYAGKEYEKEIEIAEYTINHQMEDILANLYERKPDVVAFSCYIWNWRLIRELICELHKIMPQLPIWLGGPEVSFDAEELLKELPMVTGVMVGEGEEIFVELLQCYREWFHGNEAGGERLGEEVRNSSIGANDVGDRKLGEENAGVYDIGGIEKKSPSNLEQIRGIVYCDVGQVIRTGERELTDISALPFLYEELDTFKNRIIYYESSRGCPFRCSYCLSSIDKKVRLRAIDTVKRELQFFLDQKVAQVKFVDRTFNCNHEHTMEIWKYIHAHDNGVTNFHFEIAADILREEEMTLLSEMRPGLVQLEIGVQSANPMTLKEINRYTDMMKLREMVERIHVGKNVHVHLDLIAGLPFEDYQSFGQSFDEVYRMRPEQLQLGFLKVLKGSLMHEKADIYGINYTSLPPYEVLYSKWISYEEICRLKRIEEMVELYYNSNQFTYTLPVLERVFASPFAMFEQLARYYEQKGYFVNNPSRAYRYEVLLNFACCYDGEREGLYRELLTYDIYLRENMKSRPGFAKDLAEYKEPFREFYEKEEDMRTVLPGYEEYQSKQIARMTHMEVFAYPVWEEDGELCVQKLEYERMVLFDYTIRNPLTNEARTVVLGRASQEGWD